MDAFTTPEGDKLGELVVKLDDNQATRDRQFRALTQIMLIGLYCSVMGLSVIWSANRAEQHYAANDKINQENLAWKR